MKAASYNLARRVVHEPRPCVECGELFVPKRKRFARFALMCVAGLATAPRYVASPCKTPVEDLLVELIFPL